MAISPQYSSRWKVIPTFSGDDLVDGDKCNVTWRDDLACYMDSHNPKWDIICISTSLSIAKHIVSLHNEWQKSWNDSLPTADEVPDGWCGNLRQELDSSGLDTSTVDGAIHAFGGWYPTSQPGTEEDVVEMYEQYTDPL